MIVEDEDGGDAAGADHEHDTTEVHPNERRGVGDRQHVSNYGGEDGDGQHDGDTQRQLLTFRINYCNG